MEPESSKSRLRRIFVRNLTLQAHIGAYGHEYGRTQPVVINAEVFVPQLDTQDDLANAYNYDLISAAVKQALAERHYQLQEALSDRIAQLLLEHPMVQAARVTVEKPEAAPGADSAGVESFYEK